VKYIQTVSRDINVEILLGRPGHGSEDMIKMDLNETGWT
jgi:hypothetical protein